MDKEKQVSDVRADVNKKLKEEFDALHDEILEMIKIKKIKDAAGFNELIRAQISLAGQIVREERDLNGNGAYAFPSYTPPKINQ